MASQHETFEDSVNLMGRKRQKKKLFIINPNKEFNGKKQLLPGQLADRLRTNKVQREFEEAVMQQHTERGQGKR